jgi:CDP-diacylglycerol---glycerol-3-phosphate 3-phosphatidyltransferase
MVTKKQIPNLITYGRGVLTLIIISLFFSNLSFRFIAIFILFIIAVLSDRLDGYLARKWQAITDAGRMFDPLFDKILTLSLYFFLFQIDGLPKLVFILLFLRELLVDGFKNYFTSKGIVIPVIKSAKIKTTMVFIMLGLSLLSLIFTNTNWLYFLTYIFGLLAIFFAYFSGLSYVKKILEILSE